jgi:hypothetical protein
MLGHYVRCSLLALGLATSTLNAQPAADSAAVHRTHLRWFDGLIAEDTTKLSSVLDPDVTLAFPGGDVMPRRDFLGYLQNGQLYYDTADHHSLRIRVYPRAAVVNGSSTLTYRFQGSAGSERLTYTATYILASGQWRMVAWQSTMPMRP